VRVRAKAGRTPLLIPAVSKPKMLIPIINTRYVSRVLGVRVQYGISLPLDKLAVLPVKPFRKYTNVCPSGTLTTGSGTPNSLSDRRKTYRVMTLYISPLPPPPMLSLSVTTMSLGTIALITPPPRYP